MARESSGPEGEERLERRGEEPEAAVPEDVPDRGESVGDPDVQLDVPVLSVDEIDLEVDDLKARVSFQAELADMVKINVGIDAEVGKAKINLKGVEAQAQLKARLDNVRAIFSEVLTAFERDPDLAQNMLRSGGPIDDLLGGEGQDGPAERGDRGSADDPGTAPSEPDGSEGGLGDLRIEEEYVDERGNLIGRARDESGRLVEEVLDDNGNVLGSKTSSEGDERASEATEAARQRADELGVELSNVRGTGSGGRILVRDVEGAAGG